MTDIGEVTQLIMRERHAKDKGWWDIVEASYLPESTVWVSWFRGSGHEFVERSKSHTGPGADPLHRMVPPVVYLDAGRSVVEAGAALEYRTQLDGVDIDLTVYMRLLYRAERVADRWGIRSLDAIFERDTLVPVIAGSELLIDVDRLARFRPAYRFFCYVSEAHDRHKPQDLLGDDRPQQVAELYARSLDWMHGADR